VVRLVKLPIKSGIFPDIEFPLSLLKTVHNIQLTDTENDYTSQLAALTYSSSRSFRLANVSGIVPLKKFPASTLPEIRLFR